jgi:hypothetical protein
VSREPFSDDETPLEAGRRRLRHAIAVLASVRDESIASDPARKAVATAVRSTSKALDHLTDLRRQLDKLADDAARETLPLRGGLVLGTERGRAIFPDEETPPATHDTPPLCTCHSPDGCTHRRY